VTTGHKPLAHLSATDNGDGYYELVQKSRSVAMHPLAFLLLKFLLPNRGVKVPAAFGGFRPDASGTAIVRVNAGPRKFQKGNMVLFSGCAEC
jgi:hypothetical protein